MSENIIDAELVPMNLQLAAQDSCHQRIRDLLEKAYRLARTQYEISGLGRNSQKRAFHIGPAMRLTCEERLTHRSDSGNCESGIATCFYVFGGIWIQAEWHLQCLLGYTSMVGSFRKIWVRDPGNDNEFVEVTNIPGPWWKDLRRDVLPYLETQLGGYNPVIAWDDANGKEKLTLAQAQHCAVENTKVAAKADLIDIKSVLAELDHLVGLNDVKASIKRHAAFLQVQQKRRAAGKKTPEISLHSIFAGPPGTGKTTVAQIMGRVYHQLGLLPSDEVIVAGLADLTGTHMGQTSAKVAKLVESAIGRTLFIDEAHSLNDGGGLYKGYGAEAINTLLPLLEKHKGELVVIMAGYDEQMNEMLSSNPGLASRFTQRFDFAPYNGAELAEIFLRLVESDDYSFAINDLPALIDYFTEITTSAVEDTFGNARFARNCYQKAITAQAERVIDNAATDLDQIQIEDVRLN